MCAKAWRRRISYGFLNSTIALRSPVLSIYVHFQARDCTARGGWPGRLLSYKSNYPPHLGAARGAMRTPIVHQTLCTFCSRCILPPSTEHHVLVALESQPDWLSVRSGRACAAIQTRSQFVLQLEEDPNTAAACVGRWQTACTTPGNSAASSPLHAEEVKQRRKNKAWNKQANCQPLSLSSPRPIAPATQQQHRCQMLHHCRVGTPGAGRSRQPP